MSLKSLLKQYKDAPGLGNNKFLKVCLVVLKALAIKELEPSKVIIEILTGDTIKPIHPLLKPGVVAVHVLDVVNAL